MSQNLDFSIWLRNRSQMFLKNHKNVHPISPKWMQKETQRNRWKTNKITAQADKVVTAVLYHWHMPKYIICLTLSLSHMHSSESWQIAVMMIVMWIFFFFFLLFMYVYYHPAAVSLLLPNRFSMNLWTTNSWHFPSL